MKEFQDIYNPKMAEVEKDDFKFLNNFDENELDISKENIEEKNEITKMEKKLKKESKKKFLIQNKLLQKKIENEKNKEKLYKLSSFEYFFISFMKKVPCLCENKMIYQIYILYIFLFIIFIVSLVYIKYLMLERTFKNYLEQNYHPFIESEVIKSQNILKAKCDEKNNKHMIASLDEELLFMEIFSKELVKRNLMAETITFPNNNDNDDSIGVNDNNNNNGGNIIEDRVIEKERKKTYEDYLGEKFRIMNSIEDIVNKDKKDNNLKKLNIYYYNFVPIIYQYFESLGLNLLNFYFIGNTPECSNEKTNNLFFKYPLENNYGVDIELTNDKIYDYIVDPFIQCNNGLGIKSDESIESKIGEKNWYYNLYKEVKENEINFRFFQIMKINQLHRRKDYSIIYDKFNINFGDIKINFLLVIRLSKPDITYPFLKFNIYNDTLLYDFLSIYNHDLSDEINNKNKIWENMNDNFLNDYDIDDGKNIIFKNPKFVENIGFFGLQNKNKETVEDINIDEDNNLRRLKKENEYSDNKIPLDNTIMVKYDEINDILNKYDFNYYYEADIIYYKLIYFFNQFLQYKKLFPNYLTTSEEIKEQTNEESDKIQKNHPCSISDIDEYYELIKSKFNYDCIYDYCFFNNCEQHDELYVGRNSLYLPNCYCLPLYCKDQYTKKNSNFEKKIREKMNIDSDNKDFDYSFTSKYDYFMYELETPLSNINNFFNRKDFIFRCKIDFDKKNIENNKFFHLTVHETEYKKDNIFLMYFYNLENLNNIINDLDKNNSKFVENLIFTYIALCFILGILIFIYVHFLCNKLISKMNQVKNIRKSIISNTKDNLDNFNLNKENTIKNKEKKENNYLEQKDNIRLLIKEKGDNKTNKKNDIKNNENEILIKENEEKNKNKSIKTIENKNENLEEDELDELMKLINSNLSIFKLEFNLNEESNDILHNIKLQYEEIIQVNKLKNKLLLKEKNKININSSNNNSINSEENETKKKKGAIEDLSVNIFCELLSLSNPKIDFSDIKTNFYYKDNKDNSLFGLKYILENINEGNNIENNDIINIEKLQNALEHYTENIHNYWKNYYEFQKSKDEI